jgi:hypothetical protein
MPLGGESRKAPVTSLVVAATDSEFPFIANNDDSHNTASMIIVSKARWPQLKLNS